MPNVAQAKGLGKRIVSPTAVQPIVFTGLWWRPGEDGDRGFYVALAPRGDRIGFVGARVYIKNGTDCWEPLGDIRDLATVGQVGGWEPGALPDAGSANSADASSAIAVQMLYGELETRVLAEAICERENLALVGAEALHFGNATLAPDGSTYVLDDFQRGLYGSPYTGHGPSEAFVLLNDRVIYFPLRDSQRGDEFEIRVVPGGFGIDEVESVFLTVPDGPDIDWGDRVPVTRIAAGDNPRFAPAVTNLRAVLLGEDVELRWDPTPGNEVLFYEVRRGTVWSGAPVVARTHETSLRLAAQLTTERTYRVRAFFVGGSFSSADATVTVTPAMPAARQADVSADADLNDAPGHDGTAYVSSRLELDTSTLVGRYTAPAVSAGSDTSWEWIVEIDTSQEQTTLPAVEPGTAEAMVTTAQGREPTRERHGPDWESTLGTVPLTSSGQDFESSDTAEPRTDFTVAKLEVRYNGTALGGWTAWQEYEPRRIQSEQAQVRVTLGRSNLNWERYVTRIRVEARA